MSWRERVEKVAQVDVYLGIDEICKIHKLREGFILCAEAVEAHEEWLKVFHAPRPRGAISQDVQNDFMAVEQAARERMRETHKAAVEWLENVKFGLLE